jgi:anti-sigma-K factor RskA
VTGPRQSREDRSADQLLAGKYVLGLLSQEANRAVEDRMRRDRGFAKIVIQWAQNMAAGIEDEDHAPVAAGSPVRPPARPSHARLRVRKRDLFLLASWHIWRSVAFWRTMTLLLFVLVLTLLAA